MALVRPTTAFVSTALGHEVVLRPQDVLDDKHPHVRFAPGMFEPIRVTIPMPGETIEQATAAPGERRDVRR